MRTLFLSLVVLLLASCSMNKKISNVAKATIFKSHSIANAHTGILVYDPENHTKLFDYQADKYFVPASNTKLATCYVAMKYLGDSIPAFQYKALNDSTVFIKGTGDPTLLRPDFFSYPDALAFLKNYRKIEVAKPAFHDFLGNGWSWGDYTEDYMAPRSEMPLYGNLVRISQTNYGTEVFPPFFKSSTVISDSVKTGEKISADRPWSENTFYVNKGNSLKLDVPYVPEDTTLLALLRQELHRHVVFTQNTYSDLKTVYSVPLDSMLSVMMHQSDNFFAEQSLLMVSNKELGFMSDRAIIRKLLSSDYAGLPDMPSWADGSGLSRYNLFSPADFVAILGKMKNEFGLDRMKKILPTGGTGTLSSLYLNDKGYIFAKTGTLNGVVALSGYLITRKNKLLIFSVLVNNHRGPASDVRKGVERFLTELRRKL